MKSQNLLMLILTCLTCSFIEGINARTQQSSTHCDVSIMYKGGEGPDSVKVNLIEEGQSPRVEIVRGGTGILSLVYSTTMQHDLLIVGGGKHGQCSVPQDFNKKDCSAYKPTTILFNGTGFDCK